SLTDQVPRDGGRHRPAIGAVGGYGIPNIRDMDNADIHGDFIFSQTVGIAAAIRILVVQFDNRQEVAKSSYLLKDLFADLRVALNQNVFITRQLARFAQ